MVEAREDRFVVLATIVAPAELLHQESLGDGLVVVGEIEQRDASDAADALIPDMLPQPKRGEVPQGAFAKSAVNRLQVHEIVLPVVPGPRQKPFGSEISARQDRFDATPRCRTVERTHDHVIRRHFEVDD